MASEDAPITGLASLGLQGRLLEVAVVAGMDEETGLHPRKQNRYNLELENLTLYNTHFQGQLLDILAGPQDGTTTMSLKDRGGNSWRQSLKQMSLKKNNKPSKNKKVQRSRSVRKLRTKANQQEEVPVSTDFLSNLPCICLPEDSRVYETQQKPRYHSTVLTDMGGAHHYAAVLTFYQQYYATKGEGDTWKLTRKVHSGSDEDKNGLDSAELCYVPCCICLVSTKPYFEVLKDSLSCFHKELGISSERSFRKVLEKFVTNLSLVVCPPPSIKVRFTLGALPIVLSPPADPLKQEQIVDIDLRLPLFVFMRDPSVLLSVLGCIMLEQRIVFFSEDYALLAHVMECFLCYIRPMEWHHQYIPILFSEIIGFVDCPGIFMMGCHSKHKMEIEKVENDLFLVDLDNARIYSNSPSSVDTGDGLSGQFALHMPGFAVDSLIRRLSELRLHNTVVSVSGLNPVSIEEMRESSMEARVVGNRNIMTVFMDFMVDIFGTTLQYMDHERREFKRTEFLESIQPTDSPFYIKAVKTYMFRRFMRERLKQTRDEFSHVVEKRTLRRTSMLCQQRRVATRIRSMDVISEYKLPPHGLSLKSASVDHGAHPPARKGSYRRAMGSSIAEDSIIPEIEFIQDYFSSSPGKTSVTPRQNGVQNENSCNGMTQKTPNQPTNVTLTLPTFPVQGTNFNAKYFYRRCNEAISDAMEKVNLVPQIQTSNGQVDHLDKASYRAGLLVLRGCYKLAEENLVQGWEDLHATAKEDARYFPERIIRSVAQSLSTKEREHLQQVSSFKVPAVKKKDVVRSQSTVRSHLNNFFNDDDTALCPLKKEPFTYMLEKNDVTTDDKIISLLYQALSENSSTNEVDPENFNAFFQTWKQYKHECERAQNSFSAGIRVSLEGSSGKMTDDTEKTLAFHSQEKVLKVSGTVSSNRGNGRLVLTSRRILFIAAGNQECKSLIDLQEVLHVNLGKMKNFISSTPALVIIHQYDSSSPMKIGLKSECALWMHLINEMKTGKIQSQENRDDMAMVDTATHNVMLSDAFYSSITDEGMMAPADAMIWVSKLCNFERMKKSGELKALSSETEEMLVLSMDPCSKQSKKSTVCAMTYSSAAIDEIPWIWIALGSGKIRLIDTTRWLIDPKPVEDWKSQPRCLCLVQKKELWVGADDGMIYVLSTSTMRRARILHDHSSPVIAIIASDNHTVVSASKNGQVIVWGAEPTKLQHRFSTVSEPHELISFIAFKNNFCCCSSTFLTICDIQGNTLQRLTLGQFSSIAINSNLTCCAWQEDNELWAGDTKGAVYVWDCSLAAEISKSSSLHRVSLSKKKDEQELQPKYSGILSELTSGIGITCMIKHGGKVWLGKSNGEIVIINASNACQERVLKAHSAPVTVLCKLENRYMISGSGEDDGKIVVWRQI